ncbi:MAG: LysR family transcriptional regulator [bacterium]|nr:LysR family transcriptional regulator [bacterium]
MNWDDVRIFLALARSGTTTAAARKLGVNQSTVSRRLKQLEDDAGVAVFERQASGLHLTEAGREMLEAAEQVEERFAVLGRQVLGRDVRLTGKINVSLPDFMVACLGPILADFGKNYPDIALEVSVANANVSLSRREADVILRLGTGAPEHLVGRRITSASVAVYGAPSYVDGIDRSELSALNWIRWEEAWRQVPPERWIDKHVSPGRVRARVNNQSAHVELSAAGLGVGFDLCGTAEKDPRLRRISDTFPFDLALWLLTHEDLRSTARIAAFMSFVGGRLAEQRKDFDV